MSFILDAIKKSDRQRQRGAAPTLLSVPAAIVEPRQPPGFFFLMAAAVVLSAGIAIGWLRPWQPEKVTPAQAPAPTPASAQPVELIPRPLPAAALPLQREAERRPEPEPPRSAARTQEQVPGAPRKAAPSPNAENLAAVPAEGAPVQRVMELRDLPLALQREIPEMRVSVHAYSPKPEARIVSINDRLLHEGDILAAGLSLQEITPDGMIFGYKEYRFRRGVR